MSGQAVNLNKSAITFGSRVQDTTKTRLRSILQIHNDGGCGKYLGLPKVVGRKKKEIFDFILEKIKNRTRGWSNKYLSEAGKEILLKTIASTIPVYPMNVFKLPKGVCEEIEKLIAEYWWSKGTGRRSMHWLSWKRMSIPKKEGGLGFRDIENFNLALLAKQVWRIAQSPSSLVARVLQGRYHQGTNILNATNGNKPSFIWRSLMEGKELLTTGLRVQIGNGEETLIWRDAWLPTHPPRAPRQRNHIDINDHTVNTLFLPGTRQWNIELLAQLMVPEDVDLVKHIVVSSFGGQDLLGWNYTDDGMYTVKSGYWLSMHSNVYQVNPLRGSVELKAALWKMNAATKLKHFLWRVLLEAMPVCSILKRRRVCQDGVCIRCCVVEEDMKHLFFSGPYAKSIWRGAGLSDHTFIDPNISFELKIKAIISSVNNKALNPIDRQRPIDMLRRLLPS